VGGGEDSTVELELTLPEDMRPKGQVFCMRTLRAYTGLTISLLATLTWLVLLMLTGRVRW